MGRTITPHRNLLVCSRISRCRSFGDGNQSGQFAGHGLYHGIGMDPRFDLSKVYWLVPGVAGVDPEDAPVGSVVWAEWVVDGDLAHEIDAREIPAEWPTGFFPLGKHLPYQ